MIQNFPAAGGEIRFSTRPGASWHVELRIVSPNLASPNLADEQDVDLGSVVDAALARRDHCDSVRARPGSDLHAALLTARSEDELRSLRGHAAARKERQSLDARERAPQPRPGARAVGMGIAREQPDRESHEQLEPERRRRRISGDAEDEAPSRSGAEQHRFSRTDGDGVEDQVAADPLQGVLRIVVNAY